MRCTRLCAAGLFLLAFGGEPDRTSAVESKVAVVVRLALDNEAAGDAAARQRLLNEAVRIDPDYGPARWHLGQVWQGGEWIDAAKAGTDAALGERTAQYAAMRAEALGSASQELRLARWCLKQDLPERARLHFWRVLTNPKASESQIKDAARQLDLVVAGGKLMTRAEFKLEQQRENEIAAAVAKCGPILEQLRPAIDGPFGEQRDQAVATLHAIDDPSVIPAIERYLHHHQPAFGEELVKRLTAFSQHEATQSLVRFAVVSPYLGVRELAKEELIKRPLHDYMPTLLAGLIAPIQSQFRYGIDRQGNVAFQQFYLREGAQEISVSRQDVLLRPIVLRDFRMQRTVIPRTPQPPPPPETYRSQMDFPPELALFELSLLFAEQHLRANQFNQAANQSNQRVVQVLKEVTGEQLQEPQQWWKWWLDYNQVHYPQKRTNYAFSARQGYYLRGTQSAYTHQTIREGGSCFLAGTTVWTEAGPRAIESIEVGDRVLSQHPDTGELAFKVVINKTVRPPTEASKLEILGESITTTLGHPIWVTGQGWEMAKNLKTGDQLHGVHGIPVVSTIDPLPYKIEAHNLVVEDFGTYFVGKCGVLVHDNTYRQPTRAVVPGLVP